MGLLKVSKMSYVPFRKNALLVIVDFFKADQVVKNVLGALKQRTNGRLDIVVIDNSCCDINFEKLKVLKLHGVKVIKNQSNIGYTKACNQGARLVESDFIFLINPDIVWYQDDTLEQIFNEFETDNHVGILGVKQINEDGSIPQIVRSFPNLLTLISRRTFLGKIKYFKKRVREYENFTFNYEVTSDVDWLQSSFIAIRSDLWNKLNGLDERFHIFMSDPDICFRAKKEGFKVRYYADVYVGADGRRCSEGRNFSIFTNKVLIHHLFDAIRYQLKHRKEKV